MSTATNQTKSIRSLCVKLKNRRVKGALLRDGTFVWYFKSLQDGLPVITRIRLSGEAVMAMGCIFNDLISGYREGAK